MPKFSDENGARWDVKLTSIAVDNKPSRNTWVAAIDDGSPVDYTGNQFPQEDAETFPGPTTIVAWPANGNPIFQGKGGEDEAVAFLRAFAKREAGKPLQQRTIVNQAGVVTVKSGGDGGSGAFVLLILLAVVLLSDKKKH